MTKRKFWRKKDLAAVPPIEVVELKRTRLRLKRILDRDNRFRNIVALISLVASLAVSAYYVYNLHRGPTISVTDPIQRAVSSGPPTPVEESVSPANDAASRASKRKIAANVPQH